MSHRQTQQQAVDSAPLRPFSFEQTVATPGGAAWRGQPTRFQQVEADEASHNFPERPFSYIETPIEDSTQNFEEQPARILHQQQQQPPPPLPQPQPQFSAQQILPHHQNAPLDRNPPDTRRKSQQLPPLQTSSAVPATTRQHEMIQRYPDEKAVSPADQHPAFVAPFAHTEHGLAPSSAVDVEPDSYGPVAMKSEEDLRSQSAIARPDWSPHSPSPTKGAPVPSNYQPHGMSQPNANAIQPDAVAYSPATFTSKTTDLADAHKPGQITHPNMDSSSPTWTYGLCACPASDLSTCFTGIFCPCIVYGKASYRLSQRSRHADATDLLGYSACNGHCILFTVLCGFQGALASILRGRVRRQYKVQGSAGDDVGIGCCCCCCSLVQSDREIKARETKHRQFAGPGMGYSAVADMSYQPQ